MASQISVEPPLLQRLRQAVRLSGLNADLEALGPQEQVLVVNNRLAQTTVRYLTSIDPASGQRLTEELRALASSAEFDLLMEDRGYTFLHVVQFLYEFAVHYSPLPERRYFCAGMGRGGGGVEVAPDQEVISLLHLLTTALPPAADRSNIGMLMQTLGPLILGKVFSAGLFHFEVLPQGEDRLRISLQYTDRGQVRDCLKAFGLEEDMGAFFLNSALHVQGTIQLGWDTFAQDVGRMVDMRPLIEDRSIGEQQEIEKTCSCAWTVTWKPEVRLTRLTDPDEIMAQGSTIYEALHRKDLQYYLERIKNLETRVQALEESHRFHELIGKSSQMQQVYRAIQQVAASDFTVLIRGQTGTGKELVARAIHHSSDRRDRPFVAVNCAAFSQTLLESELFGHEKGAFTGADRTRPGRFEMADGGTLFLDEVGDIPLTTQVKLLRVLETRTFERVGGTQSIQTDVRLIGATNRPLEEMIARKELREDFYFRLNVLPIHLPGLREHRQDIPLLAQHFVERVAERAGKNIRGLSRGAIERLMDHSWPGNIRELLNVIERAVVVFAQGPVLRETDISQALGVQGHWPSTLPLNLRQQQILENIRHRERGATIEDLLERASPSTAGTPPSRRTLQNDLKRLSDLGYLTYHKRGSARCYTLTPAGVDVLQGAQKA
jgi:DNA-binding NtrC family response regulator